MAVNSERLYGLGYKVPAFQWETLNTLNINLWLVLHLPGFLSEK
jgi:hypothetical protein